MLNHPLPSTMYKNVSLNVLLFRLSEFSEGYTTSHPGPQAQYGTLIVSFHTVSPSSGPYTFFPFIFVAGSLYFMSFSLLLT